jgi:iron complex outermembrane receptor protein
MKVAPQMRLKTKERSSFFTGRRRKAGKQRALLKRLSLDDDRKPVNIAASMKIWQAVKSQADDKKAAPTACLPAFYFIFTIRSKKRPKRNMRALLLPVFFGIAVNLTAQVHLRGKVVDAQSGQALTGATIRGVGSGEGVYSDGFGEFNLRTFGEAIRISFIGYQQAEISNFRDGDNLLIKLSPLQTELPAATVTARATPVALRVPAPLQRIAASDFLRDPDVSIAPSLNRVTGVYMQSATLNTNRITLRGIGNRSPFATAKLRAFLDDIPLTSGVGETTIEDIDLSLIEEVKVWKGPTASVYGAGLGGMIHLKSRQEWREPGAMLTLSGLVGSFGLARGVADFQYLNLEQTANLNLNYNRTHSDGWRENNQYDRESLTAYARFRSGERDETSVLANYIRLKAFIPSSLSREDYLNNPRMAAANWARIRGFEEYDRLLAGISHRHDFVRRPHGKTLSNTTSLFTTFSDNYEPRPFNILRENSRSTGLRSIMEYRNTTKRNLPNLALGVELFRENYDWQTNAITSAAQIDSLLTDYEETRSYANFFAEANYDITRELFFTAGINVNQTRYRTTDRYLIDGDRSGKRAFPMVVSPRLGLGYALLSRVTAFAVVSHGFAPPTLEETLTPEGTINPEIRPEKGWNFEAGLRGDHFVQRLSFEFTLYTMRVSDLLVARRTAEDQYIGLNAGRTMHNGFESYLRIQLAPALGLWGAYTLANYRFVEFIDDDRDFSGNDLTGQPPHHLNAGIDLQLASGWYAYLTYQYVDAYPVNDANTVFNDAYQLLNFKAGYQRPLGQRLTLDVYAGINNLADIRYAPMTQINAVGFGATAPRYFYPGLPRNFFGGLKLSWRLK